MADEKDKTNKEDEIVDIEEKAPKKANPWDEFIRESKVNKDVLEKEGNKAVVINYKGFETKKSQEGEEYTKAIFSLQFPSGNIYDFEMSENGARNLTNELRKASIEVKSGADIVGTRILMNAKERGQFKWIETSVIDAPKK
jgi:hypothetical protein